jgi:ribosomal protein S18 acetylase RimI-like enzyme
VEAREIFTRILVTDDLPQIKQLAERYAACYPGSIGLRAAHNDFLDIDSSAEHFGAFDSNGRLVGFGSILPDSRGKGNGNPLHLIQAELRVSPDSPKGQAVRSALLDSLMQRAEELVGSQVSPSAQVVFQYSSSEVEDIRFLREHDFVHTESLYRLVRDLTLPIPDALAVPGMKVIPCRMESEAEQRAYVDARNQVFPDSRITLEDWQRFIQTPPGQVGTCLAAFDGDDLAGSVMLFWDEEQNRSKHKQAGLTEFLFVLPRWRGLGLGSYLLTQGLLFLKKQGFLEARLEVRAADIAALGLYNKLGYQVERERCFLVYTL